MRTALRNLRRAGACLAVATLLASLAGVAALPAAADPGQVPAITDPFEGAVFHDVPNISGTGEPGTTASIADGNGTPVCSAPIDDFGYFQCTGTELLPAGPNELTVTATTPDGASTVGNTVQVTAEYSIQVGYPQAGALVSARQAFSGTALPGVQVQMVAAGGTAVCTTVSDDWGDFQCIPSEALPEGPLTLAPSMTVVAGSVVVGAATSWTVIADPVITSPANGAVVGDLPVFSGTAHPGTDISINHGRSGLALCTAKVGADGTFSCPMARKLFVGSLEVFPETSLDGVGSVMGTVTTLAVQVTPVIVRPATGGFAAALAVIEGTAGAFSTVAVVDGNGTTVCTAKADANGAFGCVATAALSAGKHTLTPVQTSFDGVPVRGAAVHVTVPGTVPGEVVPTTPATTAPAATQTPVATVNAAGGATQQLANTGVASTALPVAVAALLLLLGGAALAPGFRRRTHG
ncbi:hypothetical protein [Arthrobacter sp. HY1533]|uniref:hypothetical protein n=1 Tax=Arthrobacter sp. HY1533 TaxID=2970919 RepID=UPI0022B9FDB0|nr:hypothetical protein [Arthrobacter sp. HY1533]